MSGIITGPYFKSAYADPLTGAPPTATQIGTVVSVLEIVRAAPALPRSLEVRGAPGLTRFVLNADRARS